MSPTLIALTSSLVPEDHIPVADAWAKARCAELREQGVNACLRRYRNNESLCVVYRVAQAQEAAQEAVA